MEHGSGDIFTVDSYSDVADQMTYDDIPTYTGSKIDPDEPVPSGTFPLYETYDYRPTVDNVTGASATLAPPVVFVSKANVPTAVLEPPVVLLANAP